MPARGSFRDAVRLAFPILAVFNLTCAHPAGSGAATPGAPAAAAPGAVSQDGTVAPLPARAETDTDDGAHRAAPAGQADRAPCGPRLRDAGRVDGRGHALRRRAPRVRRRRPNPGGVGSAPAVVGMVFEPAGRQRRQQRRRRERRVPRHPAAAARARRTSDRARLPACRLQRRARTLSFRASRRRVARGGSARARVLGQRFRPPRHGQRLGRVRGGARPRALSRTHGEGGRRPVRSARRGTRKEARGARHEGERASRSRTRRRPRQCRAQRRAARRA